MDYYSGDSPSRYGHDNYRRQSPGYHDRRSRMRSRSPHSIDRYQPRDRSPRDRSRDRDRRDRDRDWDRRDRDVRDTERDRDYYSKPRDDDFRRRSPTVVASVDRYIPGQEPVQYVPTTNPMMNPNNMDTPAGFTYFSEWWRVEQQIQDERDKQKYGSIRPERQKLREDRVKEREHVQAAYDQYKSKFHTQLLKSFIQQHKGDEWFKERYDPDMRQGFMQELNNVRREAFSRWAADIDSGAFDRFTLEGIPKSEVNGSYGSIDKEEGETGSSEVFGVGDLLVSPGSDIRDPALGDPTLLIKTIAPTVSRSKLEALCIDNLGSEEGGFKWLSLSDPNPLKKYHRIGWITLKPRTGSPMAAEEEGEEHVPLDSDSVMKALDAINGKTVYDESRGDFTCHVGIHEPPSSPRRKALWDLLSSTECIERDYGLIRRLTSHYDSLLGSEYSGLARVEAKVLELRSSGLLKPSGRDRTKEDALMRDESADEGEEEEEGLCDDEEEDEEFLAKKKTLDLLVEYLRRVFNVCFYCVFESDSVHELTRKCPGGHLRRPRSCLTAAAKQVARALVNGEPFPLKRPGEASAEEEPSENGVDQKTGSFAKVDQKAFLQLQRAFSWVKAFETKVMQILEPEKADLVKLGGRPEAEAVDEDLWRYVKQEDEAKFRCKLPECTKLFKAVHFWRNHVEKRHEGFFLQIKKEIRTTNAYVLDPGRLIPPYQRPDLLSQMDGGVNSQRSGVSGFSHGSAYGNGMRDGRAGPIRSRMSRPGGHLGPNRHNQGPYSREGPVRGSNRDSPGVELRGVGEREGGVVGRESMIPGRSLKSYEDLDAAGGGDDGGLDY